MPIITFEKQTAPLSDNDKAVAMQLLGQIEGLKKPRQTSLLINYFRLVKGIKLDAPKVRAMVHYLRTEHHAPIIGTSRGYYWASNQAQIDTQIQSLEQRARSIQQAADALKLIKIN